MHVRAPKGCGNISVGGVEMKLNEGGVVSVPDRYAEELIQYHGFKSVRPEEIRTDRK